MGHVVPLLALKIATPLAEPLTRMSIGNKGREVVTSAPVAGGVKSAVAPSFRPRVPKFTIEPLLLRAVIWTVEAPQLNAVLANDWLLACRAKRDDQIASEIILGEIAEGITERERRAS